MANKDQEVKAAGIFSGDVTQKTSPCTAKVCKRDVKNFSPTDTSLANINTVQCSRPDPCFNKKLQTNAAKADRRKSVGVTVPMCGFSVSKKTDFSPCKCYW